MERRSREGNAVRINPKVKGIPPFLAGSRPGRLRKRRTRARDLKRQQWYSRYVMDDVGEIDGMVA